MYLEIKTGGRGILERKILLVEPLAHVVTANGLLRGSNQVLGVAFFAINLESIEPRREDVRGRAPHRTGRAEPLQP